MLYSIEFGITNPTQYKALRLQINLVKSFVVPAFCGE